MILMSKLNLLHLSGFFVQVFRKGTIGIIALMCALGASALFYRSAMGGQGDLWLMNLGRPLKAEGGSSMGFAMGMSLVMTNCPS